MTAKGGHLSPESLKRMSKAHLGKQSGEWNPMYGKHHTPEARQKISAARRGKLLSPEHRRKIGEASKARWQDPEHRVKMRSVMLGKPGHPCSPETRRKISEARLGKFAGENHPNFGKHPSPETRAKLSAAKKGKPLPPEHRRKISEAGLGRHHTPETRRKLSEARWGERNPMYGKRQPFTPETRAKMSAAAKIRGEDPGYKAKMSAAKKGQSGMKLENHPNWRGGISFEPYCQKFSREFKERVRAFWGHECVLCGKTQVENGRKLHIHHVNYRKDSCCNEEIPRYFVPLCISCHSKTGHDREKWEKKLTGIIEERHGGKCYLHKGEVLAAWGAV